MNPAQELKREIYAIPALDLIHLYVFSGSRASVITYEVQLDEEIDRELLREALIQTLERWPHFRLRTVVQNNQIYLTPNQAEPVVLEEDGGSVCLGEESVQGYLFALSAGGCCLRLRCHHVLADGRGSLLFLKALLYGYCAQKGESIGNGELQQLEEERGGFIPYLEKHADSGVKPGGTFKPGPGTEVFLRPEAPFSADSHQGEVYEFSCPIGPVLKLAKRADTTPVPLLNILIAQAYRNIYPVGEKIILGGSAVDYRAIFRDQAVNNGAGSVLMPYFPQMEKLDLGTQATVMRARMDLELQPENLISGMNFLLELIRKFKAIPLPVAEVPALIKSRSGGSQRTFLVSYVGGLRLPPAVQKHVERIALTYVPYPIPTYFTAIENNGVLRITCVQNYAGDALAREFYRLLKTYIPQTAFGDRGLQQFDSFYLTHNV